jgi:glycosyltransferase involved in cell wall biosynthesis
MARPTFSVVIDSYNHGRFVAQAIDSVLAQDVPADEVELIVVDDGSTDDTCEVVRRYGDKVRLIVQKNAGQAAAFATGFAAGRGEIFALLDSDDYWAPNKLSEVAAAMRDPSVGIVQHCARDVDVAGRPLPNPMPDWPPVSRLEDLLDGRFINAANSSISLRRSTLDKLLPVPPGFFYLHDDYLLKHGLLHTNIANISKELGFHRVHGANFGVTSLSDPVRIERRLKEEREFRAGFEAKLRERGLAFTPRSDAIQRLELARWEIIGDVHRGRRGAAASKLWDLMRERGTTGLGFFRTSTLLIALASPALYLRLHAAYARRHWMARLRRRLLPA